VITFGGEQLTGEFRVNDSGNIAVPLLGPVRAAGLTTNALADEITDRLRRSKLFTNPSVAVEVTSYRPIFVLGEVNHPGQYPYQPGMTVLSAVAIAGGFTYRAVTDYASIVRTVNGRPIEGKVQRQSLMQPGDVLTIFERYF
jgi:polysaccharide export outer membrane protein